MIYVLPFFMCYLAFVLAHCCLLSYYIPAELLTSMQENPHVLLVNTFVFLVLDYTEHGQNTKRGLFPTDRLLEVFNKTAQCSIRSKFSQFFCLNKK